MIIAFLIQFMSFGKIKALVCMKRSMDSFIFQFFGCDQEMIEIFRIQDKVINSIFVDLSVLILKGLTAINVGIDISELRDSNPNADGRYVNSDGEFVSWFRTP
jgi:hypothetical protein